MADRSAARLSRILVFNLATDANHPILGFTTSWINALAQQADAVDVVTFERGLLAVADNVRVFSLGREEGVGRFGKAARFYRAVSDILRCGDVSVCFSHMTPLLSILAAPILKMDRVPIVTWFAHPSRTMVLRIAHWVSASVVTSVAAAYPLRHDKLTVIGQGIDTRVFSPGRTAPDDPPMILCVGRLSPIKRQDVLLEAVQRLRSSWDREFRVVMVGGLARPSDEDWRRRLLKMRHDYGLENTVTFIDGTPSRDLADWYRRSTAHVNLTQTGSGDKVVLEAMACGRLSIVANEGFSETLGGYASALTVAYGDPDQLAERLRWSLELPPERRARIGDELRARVEVLHGLEQLGVRLSSVLRRCASEARPSRRAR